MVADTIIVIPTRTFERNIDNIEQHFIEQDEAAYFQLLLDKLFDEVIPNLEAFPEIGRDFLLRQAASVEGSRLYRRIRSKSEGLKIREYIFDQYLLLYSVRGENLHLLAIRHYAQLSFDFRGHWPVA